jgi:hypothetical protein
MISFITDQPVNSLLEGTANEHPTQAQSAQSANHGLFESFKKVIKKHYMCTA